VALALGVAGRGRDRSRRASIALGWRTFRTREIDGLSAGPRRPAMRLARHGAMGAGRGRAWTLLVNNAGFGVYGASRDMAPRRRAGHGGRERARPARADAGLPAVDGARRAAGTIVNIASNSAFVPAPGLAVYAATKAFVRHYSERPVSTSWNRAGSPVRIMTVCPSAVADTPVQGAARRPRTCAPSPASAPPRRARWRVTSSKGYDRGQRQR
jgi:NAD(P)-dependent dehydrogenase (short-subunit alcohol dehydrogenase family)